MPDPTPRLIVVTGRPGAGKSTLTAELSRRIRCPAVCRDALMEGRVNTTGVADDDAARAVYGPFFDTLALLLSGGVSVIGEAAFQHKLWAAPLARLTAVARVRVIVCSVDGRLAVDRRVQRGAADPDRARFHPDLFVASAYDPPRVAVPTLTVDTTDGYRPSLADVAAFAVADD